MTVLEELTRCIKKLNWVNDILDLSLVYRGDVKTGQIKAVVK